MENKADQIFSKVHILPYVWIIKISLVVLMCISRVPETWYGHRGSTVCCAIGRICHIARNGDILAVELRIGMISSKYFNISVSSDLEPRNVTPNLP